MITINATGDTTIHTAGKYCPEDILVKIPPSAPATELVTETAACNIVGQCYATNAGSYGAYSTSTCYAGANSSNYYPYIMQFKTPVFKGTSKSIKFSLSIKSQYHANISLNYALATSDANKNSYKRTYATVADANQIASGILTMNGMSTSTYGDWIIDVSTAQLKSETTYYLFLWGTSNATLTSVNNIDEQKHSINVEYEYEKVISGGSGGCSPIILETNITDNGFYEPGKNEYIIASDDLHLSTRTCVVIYGTLSNSSIRSEIILFRSSVDDEWEYDSCSSLFIHSDSFLSEFEIKVVGSFTAVNLFFMVW